MEMLLLNCNLKCNLQMKLQCNPQSSKVLRKLQKTPSSPAKNKDIVVYPLNLSNSQRVLLPARKQDGEEFESEKIGINELCKNPKYYLQESSKQYEAAKLYLFEGVRNNRTNATLVVSNVKWGYKKSK